VGILIGVLLTVGLFALVSILRSVMDSKPASNPRGKE